MKSDLARGNFCASSSSNNSDSHSGSARLLILARRHKRTALAAAGIAWREIGFARGVDSVKDHEKNSQNHEIEDAAFGADRATRQPGGTVKRRREQMAGHDDAAIGHRVDVRLAVVPGGMKSDGEPQASRAAQGEAKKHPDD